MGNVLSRHWTIHTRAKQEQVMLPDPLSEDDRLDMPKRIFLCPICEHDFRSYGSFYGHMWLEHPGKYICGACEQEFDGNQIADTTTSGFDHRFEWLECPKCKQIFGSLELFTLMAGYFYKVQTVYLFKKDP